MRDALADVYYLISLRIAILSHYLEWSEKLSGNKLSLLDLTEVLEGYKDACGLPSAVTVGNRVVLQRLSSKYDLSAIKL